MGWIKRLDLIKRVGQPYNRCACLKKGWVLIKGCGPNKRVNPTTWVDPDKSVP